MKPREEKKILRAKALEYLANPENKEINRLSLALIGLGYKQAESLYQRFPAAELDKIYDEALAIRRKRYASAMMKVDQGKISCPELLYGVNGRFNDLLEGRGNFNDKPFNRIPGLPPPHV